MRKSPGTHPLLIQLEQLLWDLGGVEGQPQTLDIEFRDDVLQHLLQRQATGRTMSRCGRNGILQDGSTECGQLAGRKKSQLITQLIKSTVGFVCSRSVPLYNELNLRLLSNSSEDQIGFILSSK